MGEDNDKPSPTTRSRQLEVMMYKRVPGVGLGLGGQDTLVFASVGRRFAAWVADGILLLIMVSAAAALLGGWEHSAATYVGRDNVTSTSTTYYLDTLWSESLLALFSLIYTVPLWNMGGATVGQRILGLRVLDATEPTPLSLPRATVRWFVLFGWTGVALASYVNGVFTVAVAVWLTVLLVSVVRDGRKQGIHDRLANSLVVRLVRP